jgi:hypothetical protein
MVTVTITKTEGIMETITVETETHTIETIILITIDQIITIIIEVIIINISITREIDPGIKIRVKISTRSKTL